MQTATKARDIVVALDPIDAIYIVSALAEIEERWRDFTEGDGAARSFTGRAERCRRVRQAIESAVYGMATP